MVLQYDPRQCLPSSAELPDSDDTPVDNELQNLIPNLLDGILAMAWPQRVDWFFGVDMGIYYDPDQPAIVPDGFLSLGVERFIGEDGRLSYVFWEEDNIPPVLALEVVFKTYGGEYERKNDNLRGFRDSLLRCLPSESTVSSEATAPGSVCLGEWHLPTIRGESSLATRNWFRAWARARNLSGAGTRMALLV